MTLADLRTAIGPPTPNDVYVELVDASGRPIVTAARVDDSRGMRLVLGVAGGFPDLYADGAP